MTREEQPDETPCCSRRRAGVAQQQAEWEADRQADAQAFKDRQAELAARFNTVQSTSRAAEPLALETR